MAANINSSPLFLIHSNPNPIKKAPTFKRVLILAKQGSKNYTSSSLNRVGSSIKIQKVFEDKSTGIVCYVDDQGEITCEGYDEGPRLHESVSRLSCHQRVNQEIVHLLDRSLLQVQVTDGGKVN